MPSIPATTSMTMITRQTTKPSIFVIVLKLQALEVIEEEREGFNDVGVYSQQGVVLRRPLKRGKNRIKGENMLCISFYFENLFDDDNSFTFLSTVLFFFFLGFLSWGARKDWYTELKKGNLDSQLAKMLC